MQVVNKTNSKTNEALVKVMAASATTTDVMMQTGIRYIVKLAIGFSGLVEQAGKGLKDFEVGNRDLKKRQFMLEKVDESH